MGVYDPVSILVSVSTFGLGRGSSLLRVTPESAHGPVVLESASSIAIGILVIIHDHYWYFHSL